MLRRFRFIDCQTAAGGSRRAIPLNQLYPESERDAHSRIVRVAKVIQGLEPREKLQLLQP
jgi:hypothetical protein